jgi:ABC-type phosphate transport system auxiliary subunit
MPANRSVPTSEERVEFRPLPGQEDDWAEFNWLDRGAEWYWLGTFPVGLALIMILLLIGVVASG